MLNVAHAMGCLLLAAALGLIVGSWPVFLAALAVLIGCGLYVGEIRPASGRR